MQCPNPACKRDLFKVRVVRRHNKQKLKDVPMLPVELICAHCNRKIKAWVTNQNLKDIASDLDDLTKQVKKMTDELNEMNKRKGFFGTIFNFFKTRDGSEN